MRSPTGGLVVLLTVLILALVLVVVSGYRQKHAMVASALTSPWAGEQVRAGHGVPPLAAKAQGAACPVCGTRLPKTDMIVYQHRGKTWFFCSPECQTEFLADMAQYTGQP